MKNNNVKVCDQCTKWYNDEGQLHCLDGPAIIWKNGDMSWYKNGQRHREDGPSIEFGNKYKAWFLNDIQYTQLQFNVKIYCIKNVESR